MTGPDNSSTPNPTSADPKTGGTQIIDGKYEVLRELPKEGNVAQYEVKAAEGVTRRVAWFDVGTPADRQQFHAYRTALRAIAPAGLTDVVARPGAYYAVWQDVSGTPLSDFLSQSNKKQETIDAVEALGNTLAEHGFALPDADIVLEAQTPKIAYLRPLTSRTPEQVAALNAPILSELNKGRVKKNKPKRPREAGAWLTFIPGLLFLGGAGWLGAQAAQIYLNPPVGEVKNVSGQPAQTAAQSLVKSGFRVEYTYGDSGSVPVGAVIRQDPAAGTNLPIGRLVTLTVNKPQPLTVPKLEDMTLDEAKAPLKDNILKMGKVVKADGTLSNTPEGRIIAQTPAPGATTQRGQPVQVVVSTGVKGKGTWIADLRGMSYVQAREHARDAGLVVTTVIKEASDRAENTVLRQDPAPFVRVTVGSPVKLVIATAKYTPPSTPAGSLPIPPRYVPPPPPVEPDLGTGNSDTGNSGTTTPPATPPNQTPNQTPSQTPQEIPPTGTGTDTGNTGTTEPLTQRSVTFSYVFPADLPAGTYTVVVQDADGEREVLRPTESTTLAGLQATAPATVRGNAVFIIRVGGAEYARVNPQ
ncbi:hypothetical protein Dxin01_03954 [Deinococcus xinjiangensis]|uniref:PASTA domain-containing protein n=1 Tax=Deinococcus xinjiangensis TaxID=457454 RepID=A0ABP9VIV8_9DEIO